MLFQIAHVFSVRCIPEKIRAGATILFNMRHDNNETWVVDRDLYIPATNTTYYMIHGYNKGTLIDIKKSILNFHEFSMSSCEKNWWSCGNIFKQCLIPAPQPFLLQNDTRFSTKSNSRAKHKLLQNEVSKIMMDFGNGKPVCFKKICSQKSCQTHSKVFKRPLVNTFL